MSFPILEWIIAGAENDEHKNRVYSHKRDLISIKAAVRIQPL
jgi:hypothetical protein